MANPRRVKTRIGGLPVIVKSLKLNLWAYKEVSGKVIVRASKRRRRNKGVDVHLHNIWFFEPPGHGLKPTAVTSPMISTRNARRTVLRHFAVGAGVKLNLDKLLLDSGLRAKPSMGPVHMPIIGVVTVTRITIAGDTREIRTQHGTVVN